MNIGLILAGGSGIRMGATQLPKQFLMLGTKPIIVHTIEQFVINEKINHTVVSVNEDWVSYTQDIINQYMGAESENITVIKGGSERSETVYLGAKYIVENFDADSAIVSHDAVRPFITQRIIEDNVEALKSGRVVNTIIPSNDTIVEVHEVLDTIVSIPERKFMYLGQTPQTFYGKDYIDIYKKLDAKKLAKVTDACKMYVDEGIEVKYVSGSQFNMKITTQFDHKLAEVLISGSLDNV